MVAEVVPLPLHAPVVVMATPSAELAVAETRKLELNAALAGAGTLTLMF
jgi:hypothetical protein